MAENKKIMTFLNAFLPSFKRHLTYVKFYKCLPFEWNEKERKLIVNETLSYEIATCAWITLGGVYFAFQFVNVFHGQHLLVDKLVAALILTIYGACFGVSLEFEPDATPMENINKLLLEPGKWK